MTNQVSTQGLLCATKTKGMLGCLATVLTLMVVALMIDSSYINHIRKFSPTVGQMFPSNLPKVTLWSALPGNQDTDSTEEPNVDEVNLDLKKMDSLISEYNSIASNSKGTLARYTGENQANSFTKWIMDKLLNVTITTNTGPSKTPEISRGMTVPRKTNIVGKSQSGMGANGSPSTPAPVKPGKQLVLLFSTWLDLEEKRQAEQNVLRTWKLWKPLITPAVFTNVRYISNQARDHGWEVLKFPKTVCGGIPVLREMFRVVMAKFDSPLFGYVNGYLLIGNGILSTIQGLVENKELMSKPLMAIVRRINVDFNHRPEIHDVKNLSVIADEGVPMQDGSSDGLFTNRLFPWDHVPDIVPGRNGIQVSDSARFEEFMFDLPPAGLCFGVFMWLVTYARVMGVQVVDISETVTMVHMGVTKHGNRARAHRPQPRCNLNTYETLKVRPLSYYCGFTKCAPFKTVRSIDDEGRPRIDVVDKSKTNHERCSECAIDLTKLLDRNF